MDAALLPLEPDHRVRHPRALFFLFLTGMWEVAALYGMRVVLVFHLTSDLGMPVAKAVEIFGLSTAASFIMSFAGGATADRLIGVRRAVVLGALLMMAGHLALVRADMLYLSLGLIALGSGLFRPSLIASVWRLYGEADPRTSDALLRYKVGCNLGGIIGPIACGALYEMVGWGAAMTFSAAGMLVAAIIYVAGVKPAKVQEPQPSLPSPPPYEARRLRPAALAGAFTVFMGGSLHWVAANQQGGTLAVFTFKEVARSAAIFGYQFTIPAGWFQAFNPLLIILLAPFLSRAWARKPSHDPERAEIVRMVEGSLLLAVSFAVLMLGVELSPPGRMAWMWLLLSTIPLTLGELLLDTMGQAYFCRHAPRRYLSTFLSLWLATSTAGYLGTAWLADYWGKVSTAAFFGLSAAVALASALTLSLVAFTNKKVPHE